MFLRWVQTCFYNQGGMRHCLHSGLRGLAVMTTMLVACRGVEPEPAPQHSHTLFPSLAAMDGVYAGPGRRTLDLGPVDPKLMIQATGTGPVTSYDVRVEPEDSIELFARWTGRSVTQLLRWNPGRSGLVAGEVFHMELSPNEAARFGGARMAYLAGRRARQESGTEVVGTFKHEVAEGETLKEILVRYNADLDALEKLNPGLCLSGIVPGRVLTIPITPRPDPG